MVGGISGQRFFAAQDPGQRVARVTVRKGIRFPREERYSRAEMRGGPPGPLVKTPVGYACLPRQG